MSPRKSTKAVEKESMGYSQKSAHPDRRVSLRDDGYLFLEFDREVNKPFNEWRGKNPDGTFDTENQKRGVFFSNGEETNGTAGWIVPPQHAESVKEFTTKHGFENSVLDNPVPTRLIGRTNLGGYYFRFPREDVDVRGQLKADVPGARYEPSAYVWTAPESSKSQVEQFAEDEGFSFVNHTMEIEESLVI